MGKTIIQQARGHGSFTYRVRRNAYRYRIGCPASRTPAIFEIIDLINSPAHTAPLAKMKCDGELFYVPAAQGIYVGQKIEFCGDKIEKGNIIELKKVPVGTEVFNLEIRPCDGGKMIRTSGGFATVLRKTDKTVTVITPGKREIELNGDCKAIIGVIAGQGRKLKPVVKAGKKWYMMKARNKLWPRTGALKFNAVDHPFGCGRGKRVKNKIAKRNAPAGAKVGHLRPSRTGVRK